MLTISVIGWQQSAEWCECCSPVSVFQIVAQTVEFTVTLDGAFRSLEVGRAEAVNDGPSSVDHWQTRMDHVSRQIVPAIYECIITTLYVILNYISHAK